MGDIYANSTGGPDIFGRKGEIVTPDSGADMVDVAKGVVVTSIGGGDVLQILPPENDDSGWVQFTGVTVGFVPPFQVRRVGAATTCTVASILDAANS